MMDTSLGMVGDLPRLAAGVQRRIRAMYAKPAPASEIETIIELQHGEVLRRMRELRARKVRLTNEQAKAIDRRIDEMYRKHGLDPKWRKRRTLKDPYSSLFDELD